MVTGSEQRSLAANCGEFGNRLGDHEELMMDAQLPADSTVLEHAFENSPDCIALVDMRGHVVYMNTPGMWLMEFDGAPFLQDIEWSGLWSGDDVDIAEYSMESARRGRGSRFTAHRTSSAGADRWWDVVVSPVLDRYGDPVRVFCICRDITEMKSAEMSLQRTLAAREALLLEVNHRIKNSLSIVAGLLWLQAKRSTDETVRKCLQQARSRVDVVAEIHRRLYETGAHDSLDIGDYITEVARGAISTLAADDRVILQTDCEHGIRLDAEQAIPITLVVAELVTNSVKHAFPEQKGTVRMVLGATATHLLLQIDDNGRGLPATYDLSASAGIGMEIVQTLIRQLRGELRVEPVQPGAHFRIVLPRETAPRGQR